MRKIAFIIACICMMFAYRDAQAQGFWYVPPGGDFSYRYGIDLGDGLGFGYSFGFGYGNLASPEAATASAYADLVRLQGEHYAVQPTEDMDDDQPAEISDDQQQIVIQLQQQQALNLQQANLEKAVTAQNQKANVSYAKSAGPARITRIEFNRTTGRVDWPSALERDEFSVHRSEMESLLKIVGKTGATSEMKARISDKAQEMHDAVRRQFRAMSNKDYLEGQRFINRLATEIEKSVS